MGDKFPRCILQKMQLVAAEPGPVTGGGRFLHRALSDPTKGDFVILDPLWVREGLTQLQEKKKKNTPGVWCAQIWRANIEGKESSQSDVSSIKSNQGWDPHSSRKGGDLLHLAPLVSCLGTIHWINCSLKGAKWHWSRCRNGSLKGSGAGQEFSSNPFTEEGWNCSWNYPQVVSGREIIILKLMLSINSPGINLSCEP